MSYNYTIPIDKRIINVCLSLIFITFLSYFILNKGFAPWRYSVLITLMGLYVFSKKVILRPNLSFILFCSLGALCVTLSYYLFNRFASFPAEHTKYLSRLINQYFWFIPFLFLPSIFYYSRFKIQNFSYVFWFLSSLALVFNIIKIIQIGLERNTLAVFFSPVIDYDLGIIAISIVALFLALQCKGRLSYLYLLISTATILTIMLHGSRGAWLGLPLMIALVFTTFYKSSSKKCYLILSMFIIFLSINALIPNSPIFNRFSKFKNDYQSIQVKEYKNSTGIRLLLWKNSLALFQTHPIMGVGIYGIEQSNDKLFAEKKLPQSFQHQHNIVFHEMAAHGLLGLLGLMGTFTAALCFFGKHWFHQNPNIHTLSCAGLTFVIYHFCAGMTEHYLFFIDSTYLFYLITASLISLILVELKSS